MSFFFFWGLIHVGPKFCQIWPTGNKRSGQSQHSSPCSGLPGDFEDKQKLGCAPPLPDLASSWEGGYQADAKPHPTLHYLPTSTGEKHQNLNQERRGRCMNFLSFSLMCKIRSYWRQTAFAHWWSVSKPWSMKVSLELAWSNKEGKSFINMSICMCVSRHSAHKDSLVGNVG